MKSCRRERGAQIPHRAQRRWGVAEHLRGHAADVDDVDREQVPHAVSVSHGAKLSDCSVPGTLPAVTGSRRPGKAAILRAAVEVIAEDGFEGRRRATWRAGPVSRLPRSTTTSRRSWACCASSSTRRTASRSRASTGDSRASTVPWRASRASSGPSCGRTCTTTSRSRRRSSRFREYTRLEAPERAAIEVQRKALLDVVEHILRGGEATGDFDIDEPRRDRSAIVSLTTSLVGIYPEIGRPLADVTSLYQEFAVRLAGASGSRPRA